MPSIASRHSNDRDAETGDQGNLGEWASDRRVCEVCGVPATEAGLTTSKGGVYCRDHEPVGECACCETPTHETAKHASYPLCGDCREARRGGADEDDSTEQTEVGHWP